MFCQCFVPRLLYTGVVRCRECDLTNQAVDLGGVVDKNKMQSKSGDQTTDLILEGVLKKV